MCEQFVARAAEPFRLDELWPFAEQLERYGLAGFGWGAAWLTPTAGSAAIATSARSATTPAATASAPSRRPSVLVHLRRPSRLSTLSLPDTQPFADPAGPLRVQPQRRLARLPRAPRRRTGRRAGSTAGRTPRSASAGSRTRWDDGSPSTAPLLATLHERFGGQANLADARPPTAPPSTTPATPRTRCSRFRLGRIGVVSTGLYSLDRSLFRFAAPGATDRRLVRLRTTVTLDPDGRPGPQA